MNSQTRLTFFLGSFLRRRRRHSLFLLIIVFSVYIWLDFPSTGENSNSKLKDERISLEFAGEMGLDCLGVVRGDINAIEKAKNWTRDFLLPKDVNRLPNDVSCSSLKSRLGFQGGKGKSFASRSPLAFAVLTHGRRYFEQTLRLLRALTGGNDVVCLHVDAKVDNATWAALRRVGTCLDGVVFVEKRINVVWARMSLVDALLSCGATLLALDIQWTHVINFASTAFPLRTNDEIAAILDFFEGRNLVHGDVESTHLEARIRMKKDPPPGRVKLVKGSQYGAFTRGFMEFALNDARSRDFRSWLRETLVPDETFWSTLNYDSWFNAPGGSPLAHALHGANFSVVLQHWIGSVEDFAGAVKFGIKCASNFERRGHCIFGVGDLPTLIKIPHIQINKFDMSAVEPAALLCLEEWRRNKTDLAKSGGTLGGRGSGGGGGGGGGGISWEYYRNVKRILFTGRKE